jgi:hypothetical protein
MNLYTKNKIIGLAIFCGIFFYGCNNKKGNNTTENYEFREEKLPYTVNCYGLSSENAYVLSDGIVSQLLRDFKNYQGHKMNIQFPIPEEWQVVCKLSSMTSDFDIWIISNAGSPTHKILATVATTSETPFVIQSIPVSCNIGIEKVNFIESEQWTALIGDDYKITITKIYEKLYSLTDTLIPGNESVYIKQEDVYNIENDGKITYETPPVFDVDYRVIIQFADTAITGNIMDERWLWNAIEIEEVIEPLGIFFGMITTGFDRTSIYNYHGEEIDIINISPVLNRHSMGFLALKKGEKPLFIPYTSSRECLQKAFVYFDIEYVFPAPESDNEQHKQESQTNESIDE